MAGHVLIDAYVDDIVHRLGQAPDGRDVADELRDHLLTAADRLIEDGATLEAAQIRALERFGSAELVATLVSAGRRTGPTRFTRWGGRAAIACGVVWPVVAIAWWTSLLLERRTGGWSGPPQLAYVSGAGALFAALSLTLVVLVALHRRHGDPGGFGRVGLACAGAAVLASTFGWLVAIWGGLLALATATVGAAVLRGGPAPRVPVIAFGFGWPVAALGWAVLRLSDVGAADEAGIDPTADLAAVSIGVAVAAVGSLCMGRWLLGDTSSPPADGRRSP